MMRARKIPEKNNLARLHPYLVNEWDAEMNSPYTPEQFTCFSHEEVWWKCSRGHSWFARIENRSHGEKCPWCYGNRPYRGKAIWIDCN